jgi:hypothetical protein
LRQEIASLQQLTLDQPVFSVLNPMDEYDFAIQSLVYTLMAVSNAYMQNPSH